MGTIISVVWMELRLAMAIIALCGLIACTPDVGSQEWCDGLLEKPKQEWTRDEVLGLTTHCIAPE